MSKRAGKRRSVAPRKRRGPPIVQRTTSELERGDVIYWDQGRHVVIEPAPELPHPDDPPRMRRLILATVTANGNAGAQRRGIVVSCERSFVIAERIEI